MPLIDLLRLEDPYIPTNGGAFYRCPADTGLGWNIQLLKKFGQPTNQVPFACTYDYYSLFYANAAGIPTQHKVSEVKTPSTKTIQVCFARGMAGVFFDADIMPPMQGAHGKGFALLLVDGHAQFATDTRLNRSVLVNYNYDTDPLN